jgi:hypothetical protein
VDATAGIVTVKVLTPLAATPARLMAIQAASSISSWVKPFLRAFSRCILRQGPQGVASDRAMAVAPRDRVIVELSLAHGADVNIKDHQGETPLDEASES